MMSINWLDMSSRLIVNFAMLYVGYCFAKSKYSNNTWVLSNEQMDSIIKSHEANVAANGKPHLIILERQ
jgi:uncharacterized membrane protein YbaN (DUF454 family)